jgi:hypothetical protein
MSEEITVPNFSTVLPGTSALGPQNVASLQLNYSLTGGTFAISVLTGILSTVPENFQFSLPMGRIATVKSVGKGYSTGGLLDIISGPVLPAAATLPTLVGLANGSFALASALAAQMGPFPVSWGVFNPLVRSFIYKGNALGGVQQLASLVAGEVLVRSGGVYVVQPGATAGGGSVFAIPKADIVSANQTIDYSNDFANVLNPALSAVQFVPEGDFVYDSDHAQKQAKTTVQAGAPLLLGSTDFIPIPDGWLVDGTFEEWTPPSGTDASNPNSTATGGRYWKDFPSPINPGMRRGILSFSRLIKQISVPGNVSSFIGSPVSGDTQPGSVGSFMFSVPGSQNGIYGFDSSGPITFFDIISNQYLVFDNAIVLVPTSGGDSGAAIQNSYSITMELWTFPKVNPQIFPVGNPVNPFNLPKDALVVNPPMSNLIFGDAGSLNSYFGAYMQNYRRTNSPRLRTTISCVYRGLMPEIGDALTVIGLNVNNCGRVSSVSLNMSRTGLVLNIVAEVYQYTTGLSGKYPALL